MNLPNKLSLTEACQICDLSFIWGTSLGIESRIEVSEKRVKHHQ